MSRTGWKALSALPMNMGYVVLAVLCQILVIKLNTERLVPLRRNFDHPVYLTIHFEFCPALKFLLYRLQYSASIIFLI
jgi:hypothetical protein